jgi:hypothetical protein
MVVSGDFAETLGEAIALDCVLAHIAAKKFTLYHEHPARLTLRQTFCKQDASTIASCAR